MFGFPLPIAHWVIRYGIGFILLAMIVRAVASLFGIGDRFAFIRFLMRITDPFINPLRHFVKPIWMIDLAFLLSFFLLITLQRLLLQALLPDW